ncbi:DUF2946 family protein [Acidovorax sp.]|uniref:DUF2946 family protein n=1 Tax=Acidovorax sp. TaxID=1872122 RepID=UPI00391D07A7
MDDIVKQAIAKWPRVPAVHGWLGLDMRGRWYLRDDATQAQGPFPRARGSLLEHEKLLEFIARNYEADAQGRWFFQNGPQRVFVELELTPWIWRVQPDFSVISHTGLGATVEDCLLDEAGRVYLSTPVGLGLVHTQDVPLAAEAIDAGQWVPEDVQAADLPARYGFVVSPHADVLASNSATGRP